MRSTVCDGDFFCVDPRFIFLIFLLFYYIFFFLLNILTRRKYLSIYICAILHVQIMLEHINISFEHAIKQSFYNRGVKDT